MPSVNYISKSDIFFSCTTKQYQGNENTVPEHALVHVYAGSMTITHLKGTYTIHEGETVLLHRNMLARFIKHPPEGGVFQSVSILFSQSFLQKFYALNSSSATMTSEWQPLYPVKKHPLLLSLFDSLLPYYDMRIEHLPPQLVDIKLQEAMTILRTVDNGTDSILTNFAEPGKLDLEDFMLKSFMFNIPLARFAFLSGRSLATFKRDFQKIFHQNPQR
ncbi:hypothetical protein J2T02_002286 [Chitinophaga terrae (ex Kim and Jung 2007)]|uniref:AraC family transcriptional regulator n=1 Tax=Chitinophaga terrae (ex Kim and Jung 2007) TaxID=408074 RepID=UPI00278A6C39|nr:AraC family transcriptional regulator [Chitinophaga terrae (ex Kim and Jung 2007)]MDQ0107169.1 hypothetical protein [Chitinophaga terrae (ex Kim and Jung 2007)]